MLWNTLLLALRSISRNLLRSFLTVLGVVIGVSAVITMVTLGDGATRAVQDQISSMGSNLIIVRPGMRMMGPSSSGAPNFKVADAEAVRAQIAGLAAVAPAVQQGVSVVRGAQNWTTSVVGSTPDIFIAGAWKIAMGRFFTEAEERAGKSVCVIGETIRKQLFGALDPTQQADARIRVKQISCEVIGVLASKGQSAMGFDQDDTIIMPLRTVQRRLTGNPQEVQSLRISVAEGASTEKVKADLTRLLRERRKLSSNEDNNFNVMDTKQIAETMSSTTRVMTMLLGAVAAVSLLVGGIGIMNIMLVSVTERTREIGIRLAIGALEREVLLQFLIEAVVLASLGGITGVLLALLASVGLARVMDIPFLFNPGINLLAFGFSAAIGVVFGYFPARRAASLDPIEALRHE